MKKTLLVLTVLLLSNVLIQAQTVNLLSAGDMESAGWSDVPKNTDLTSTFEAGMGPDTSTCLRSVVTNMGGSTYYILRCEESFHLDKYARITVSFRAKASEDGIRLQPWIQEGDSLQWMNFGDAYLSTDWQTYTFTAIISTITSDNYKFKFRGYNTGTVYLDDVKLEPDKFGNIPQSDIYEVSVNGVDSITTLPVFRHACPEYIPDYQGMDSKDQTPLSIFAGRTINWAKFPVDDPVTVHVKVTNTEKVPVSGQSVRILPSRFGIVPVVVGNEITFTITEPAQYSVEIGENGYKNGLLLFADPPETDIPDKADPDFLVLHEATAADLADIPLSYKGIYFANGIHDIGVFHIPGNIKKVYFEDGSWVYGTLIMDSNPNVRIYGRGVLSSARLNYRQSHCVEAINGSDNISLEGLVITDPKYFAVRLIGRNNTVKYTKIVAGWVWNCDGIAAYAGSDVSKCFVWANDDAIKVYRDSITWSDIVVWQLDNGGIIQMSWGGAVGGSTSRGVKLRRIDILHAEWDKPGFNTGLLCNVGNHYHNDGKSDLMENWLIEDVVTENPVQKVFKITPDPYSPNHIHGLVLKNWNVKMPLNTSFVNEIKCADPDEYFSGFVFDSIVFNNQLLTNVNYITNGDMDEGGWEAVPGSTNQVVTLESGIGIDGSNGLKSVVTNLGGDDSYMIKCDQLLLIPENTVVNVRFYAKSNITGARLIPVLENEETKQITDLSEVELTRDWAVYNCSVSSDLLTSGDKYVLLFRGLDVNTVIYLDDVSVGPPDWRTVTQIETQYLEEPVFLPEFYNPNTGIPVMHIENRMSVYPNPVSSILNITGGNPYLQYRIYNVTGSMILRGRGNAINVSAFESGIYILVTSEGGRIKFVKR